MLNFITGVPGAGKTLFALSTVEAMRKAEPHRQVFAYNVDGLNIPEWQVLADGQKWHETPAGSIVVMDEAQKVFRTRSAASSVPAYVSAFEEHRHSGHDVFLITQHPTLVDPHVRKLAGKHYHVKRTFGSQMATVYEWLNRVADPNAKHEYKDVREKKWKYPTEVFSWYKSAEIHNVKRDLPWRQIAIIVGLAAFISGAIYWVFSDYGNQAAVADSVEIGQQHVPARERKPAGNPWDATMRQARVSGFEFTAPLYDDLQRPISKPAITGCARIDYGKKIDCFCNNSQGSRVTVTLRECMAFVRLGWFDPTRQAVDVKAQNIAYLNARDGIGGRSESAAASTDTGS